MTIEHIIGIWIVVSLITSRTGGFIYPPSPWFSKWWWFSFLFDMGVLGIFLGLINLL